VAQSDSESVAERNADDMSLCGELMEKVLKVGYEVGNTIKVIRLGKYEDKLKRSLLVELANGHVKNVVNNLVPPELCDRTILHIICIFHYARIIVQGVHNLRIIVFLCNSQFIKFFILSSFLIASVSDEVN